MSPRCTPWFDSPNHKISRGAWEIVTLAYEFCHTSDEKDFISHSPSCLQLRVHESTWSAICVSMHAYFHIFHPSSPTHGMWCVVEWQLFPRVWLVSTIFLKSWFLLSKWWCKRTHFTIIIFSMYYGKRTPLSNIYFFFVCRMVNFICKNSVKLSITSF